MRSQKNLPLLAQNTQHKLGVAFSYLERKNQNVMIILTRSLTSHIALEAVLFSVVVFLYCKFVAQAKGGLLI